MVSPCQGPINEILKCIDVKAAMPYLEAHTACVRQAVDDDRGGGWPLAQVAGHVLHGLVHLVAVSEDEPRGKNVLEAAASQSPVNLAVFGEILKYKILHNRD